MRWKYLSIYDPPYMPMNEDEMAVVYGMGLCYLAKGIKDKAIEYLERVEVRNGKFGNVSKYLLLSKKLKIRKNQKKKIGNLICLFC